MGDSGMTLTEFLLARIAEDEKPTWTLHPYYCAPDCCAPAGWVGLLCRFCDATPVYGGTVEAMTRSAEEHAEDIHQRSRVMAECAAKRRIVTECLEGLRCDMECLEGHVNNFSAILRLLARLDADHPDYLQEWQP